MFFREMNHTSTNILHRKSALSRDHSPSCEDDGCPKPLTALITGASSGIGAALAGLLASNGFNLVLIARDHASLLAKAAELESGHGVTATALAGDLGKSNAAAEIERELARRSIHVDVLVNNAGFAIGGEFISTDVQKLIELLNVNIVATAHLTRLLVPGMVSRRWGRVLNVASIAGFYPGPLTAIYNASKACVISLSLALRNELEGTGVSVTCLCPGPTDTGFACRAGLCHTRAFSKHVMGAAEVASIGYQAMMSGKALEICGLHNKLRMLPIPLVPYRVLAHFSRKYHQLLPME